jgi:transketolase
MHSSHKVPGVEFSTGSLGHGLPYAVGRALAQKVDKKKSKIYVLLNILLMKNNQSLFN